MGRARWFSARPESRSAARCAARLGWVRPAPCCSEGAGLAFSGGSGESGSLGRERRLNGFRLPERPVPAAARRRPTAGVGLALGRRPVAFPQLAGQDDPEQAQHAAQDHPSTLGLADRHPGSSFWAGQALRLTTDEVSRTATTPTGCAPPPAVWRCGPSGWPALPRRRPPPACASVPATPRAGGNACLTRRSSSE